MSAASSNDSVKSKLGGFISNFKPATSRSDSNSTMNDMEINSAAETQTSGGTSGGVLSFF